MTNNLCINECRSYATEANLDKALAKLGLDNYGASDEVPCRFIKVRNSDGRWTAIFMVAEYFSRNRTGGYVSFASQHGFMSI